MKKNFTVKDCTKENFEKSLNILKDAQKALENKAAELSQNWADSGFSHEVYMENQKILNSYHDAIIEAQRNIVPYVGLKCSIKAYTDSYACVITKVISPNKVEVMHLEYDTVDYYGGEYKIYDKVDKNMPAEIYSRRKNGEWYTFGQDIKHYPCRLRLNSTHHFIDPNF